MFLNLLFLDLSELDKELPQKKTPSTTSLSSSATTTSACSTGTTSTPSSACGSKSSATGSTDPSACSGSSSAASACGTSSSTTSGDTSKEEYWNRAKTLMFIDNYEELMDQLENPQVSKSKVFEKICQRLATAGHVVTKQACMDKLRQLKYIFRKKMDAPKKTGAGAVKWPYYERMKELMSGDPALEPLNIITTLPGDPSTSTDEPPKKSWKNVTVTALTIFWKRPRNRHSYSSRAKKRPMLNVTKCSRILQTRLTL